VSYAIGQKEDWTDGSRRILRELFQEIFDIPEDAGLAPVERARLVRVRVKKLRTLLGLTGAGRRADRRWRDAARLLSAVRDQAAAVAILERLAARPDIGSLRPALERVITHNREHAVDLESDTMDALRAFALAAGRARRGTPLPDASAIPDEEAVLRDGYRRARRAWRRARASDDAEDAHEWRKAVKDLLNRLRLLRRRHPHLAGDIQRFRAHAARMGEARDLEIAAGRIRLLALGPSEVPAREAFCAVLADEARRARLDALWAGGPDFSMRTRDWIARRLGGRDAPGA